MVWADRPILRRLQIWQNEPGVSVKETAATPRTLAAFLLAFSLLAPTRADAAGDILVTLDYLADPVLGDCPTAGDFAEAIVRQLGRDPFRERASRRAVVRLYPIGARIGGRVEWRDANDEWEGERTFSSRNESCAQMARSMALATAIQIQLLAQVERDLANKPVTNTPAPAPIVIETNPQPMPAPPAPVAPKSPTVIVEAGIGVLQDLGDAPALIVPRLAVTVGRPSTLAVRLALGGLGPGAHVTRPDGVAEIDRVVVTVDAVHYFRSGQRVQPLVAIGAGWQDVRASGISTMPPLVSRETQALTALVTASGGLAFAFGARFAAILEVETLLFRPAIYVNVGSAEAAHLEGATLFAHGGLLARF
jgi:hypothetical protein